MVFFQQNNVSFGFSSLALNRHRPSLSFAGLPPTFSFPLYCLSFKFVDMTIYLSLILYTKRIQRQLFSFVVSALQDTGGYVISLQNNLELHLGCHTCWLSYFTLVCLWCGRTVSPAGRRCTVTWSPNFLRWVDYLIFLPMVKRKIHRWKQIFQRWNPFSDFTFDCKSEIRV